MSDHLLEELDSVLSDLKAAARERAERALLPREHYNIATVPLASEMPIAAPSTMTSSIDPEESKVDDELPRNAVPDMTRTNAVRPVTQSAQIGRISRVVDQIRLRLRPLFGHRR